MQTFYPPSYLPEPRLSVPLNAWMPDSPGTRAAPGGSKSKASPSGTHCHLHSSACGHREKMEWTWWVHVRGLPFTRDLFIFIGMERPGMFWAFGVGSELS